MKVCDSARAGGGEVQAVRADLAVRGAGAEAFADDGLHLSGSGYDLVLAALADALGRPGD